jgi:hypothetical protein
MMIVALILLLGMAIPIALIVAAVGADALFVLWLGITGASDVWKKRLHPWVHAHGIHHLPRLAGHR